jgi:DNA-binding transcriptional MerR regulator
MRIGILAELAGTTVPTVRYYEEIGLLRQAARQGGGQRTYDREDVRRLAFVRRCREFGFAIDEVRALLLLTGDRSASCIDARDLAERHLQAVRLKLVELKALETAIASLVSTCNSTCAGGVATDCSIFVDLNGDGQDGRPVR